MTSESKATFFKQSSWLVVATTMSGVFLVLVYPVVNRMPADEMAIFMSMLRLFTVLAIPAVGLQVVMAQEAAAAITPEDRQRLAVTSRSVLRAIFGVWLIIAVVCVAFRHSIATTLKLNSAATLWVTLALVLGALCVPIAQGLLQGTQKFPWLAGSILLNGLGRFLGVAFAVLLLKTYSAGALFGAFVGVAAAALIGFWPNRELLRRVPGRINWREWSARLLPLTGGAGAMLFVINADVLFVQSHFPATVAGFYSAVAVIGVGLVSFTAPMAAVMFPKLVSSVAQSKKSNSFVLALTGTALLGAFGALVCTVLPWLPLRILHFNKPDLWDSAQLVPWFMWAMLPVTIANVVINNLLAQRRFAAVPWLVAIAVIYGFNLNSYLASNAAAQEHWVTFRGVILRLGGFSSLLLLTSIVFTVWPQKKGEAA